MSRLCLNVLTLKGLQTLLDTCGDQPEIVKRVKAELRKRAARRPNSNAQLANTNLPGQSSNAVTP